MLHNEILGYHKILLSGKRVGYRAELWYDLILLTHKPTYIHKYICTYLHRKKSPRMHKQGTTTVFSGWDVRWYSCFVFSIAFLFFFFTMTICQCEI